MRRELILLFTFPIFYFIIWFLIELKYSSKLVDKLSLIYENVTIANDGQSIAATTSIKYYKYVLLSVSVLSELMTFG